MQPSHASRKSKYELMQEYVKNCFVNNDLKIEGNTVSVHSHLCRDFKFTFNCPFCHSRKDKNNVPYSSSTILTHSHTCDNQVNRSEIRAPKCLDKDLRKAIGEYIGAPNNIWYFKIIIDDKTKKPTPIKPYIRRAYLNYQAKKKKPSPKIVMKIRQSDLS